MRAKASVSPDRMHVILEPVGGTLRELTLALRGATPPIRVRREDGLLAANFDEALRLAEVGLEISFTEEAERALANRRHVDRAAPRVLERSRELTVSGAQHARRSIADSVMARQLDDHQAVNVAVMVVPDGWGTCVFDEQGTGKTATVVAAYDLLVERGEADTLIVVAPKSMVAEWAEEFRRFLGAMYRVAVLDGTRRERARAVDSGANVVVLNYESVSRLAVNLRLLAKRTRAVLAVDESFFVKNPGTARTHAVKELREWCSRCFVLCGTPAPNRPDDLVAQFDLVDFGRTFRGVKLDKDRDTAADQVIQVLQQRGFFVRNRKQDVLSSLPGRRFSDVVVPLAPHQQRAYDAALDDLILDLRESSDAEFHRRISSFLERRSALLRICSDPAPVVPGYEELPAKLAALDELIGELVEGRGEKLVIWSFYRAALDRIAARYAHFGMSRIDGSVAEVAARREAVRKFQEDDETLIFVGNPAAAGAGLTLHRAHTAVYESMSNQAAHFLQSLDRIHRRGQTREVEYVTLLAQGTVEGAEYARLLEKADRQGDLLGDRGPQRVTRTLLLDELLASRSSEHAQR